MDGTSIWYSEEKEDDHRLDRYDYPLPHRPTGAMVPQIKETEQKTMKVRIYFNNHARTICKECFSLDGPALERAQGDGNQVSGPIYPRRVLRNFIDHINDDKNHTSSQKRRRLLNNSLILSNNSI